MYGTAKQLNSIQNQRMDKLLNMISANEGINMKINKLLYLSLVIPVFLMGCGGDSFKEQEIRDLYNQFGALNPKVKSASNIDCHQDGYIFPEEKKRPIFKCEYDLESETGQKVKEKSVLTKDEAGRLSIFASALLEGSNVRY